MLKMLDRMAFGAGMLSLVLACSPAVTSAQTQPKPATPTVQQHASNSHVYSGPKGKLKGKRAIPKKKVAETPPPPPPPPPTPEQMPAQPPEVSYAGGLLTINAPNSTMNDVLAAVRRVTGATIEKPPMGGTDRVVAHLGPGQPKDVLSALFNGSRYDYIILGPMGQPGAVQRVILTARSNAPAQSPVMANVPGRPAPNQSPAAEQQEQENSTDTEDMTVPEQNQPEQEQPAQEQQEEQPQQPTPQPGYPQPVSPEQQPQTQPPQPQENQSQQPRVKSPEELLRELQQMQQQQQNQQNQQNQQQPPQ